MKKLLFLFIISFSLPRQSLSMNTDSLWKIWNDESVDKIKRLNILQDLAQHYAYNNFDTAVLIAKMELDFAKKNGLKAWEATAYGLYGTIFWQKGYLPNAIQHFLKALKIMEEMKDYKNQAYIHCNIANVYSTQSDEEKSLFYLKKGFAILDTMKGEEYARSQILNNLGLYYLNKKQFEKSTEIFVENLAYYKSINDDYGIAHSLNNLGSTYRNKKEYNSAITYYEESGEYFRKIEDFPGETMVLRNIGYAKYHSGDYQRAYKECKAAFDIAIANILLVEQSESCECLFLTLKKLNRHEEALFYHEKLLEIKDSVLNEQRIEEITQATERFSYDKRTATDSVEHAKEKEISDAKIAQSETELRLKRNQQYVLFGGLGLVLIFAFFMYNRFKVTRRQKNLIEKQKEKVEEQNELIQHQKEEVEEKNKEILDSITYARRLQEAILPPQKVVKEYLPHSFILYKPKDIVAGDFYFMETVDNKIIIAAADCTGHGVPGAMVSVVCANALNRAVKEFKLIHPGEILTQVRKLVIETFERSEDEVKDGMDISLCVLDLTGKQLFWAGANNPLWIIRNGEVIEFKPDKQPIGKYADQKPFTSHAIDLKKEDSIYIFTDGYEDQFGGEKGKKFKTAKMKELFLSIQEMPMEIQNKMINEKFENWRGDLEQVDDVCVIGIKV